MHWAPGAQELARQHRTGEMTWNPAFLEGYCVVRVAALSSCFFSPRGSNSPDVTSLAVLHKPSWLRYTLPTPLPIAPLLKLLNYSIMTAFSAGALLTEAILLKSLEPSWDSGSQQPVLEVEYGERSLNGGLWQEKCGGKAQKVRT